MFILVLLLSLLSSRFPFEGAWKTLDMENERLTRAAAAVGAETLAKLKDLNILVIGCKGEATFNLSNRYPITTSVASLQTAESCARCAATLPGAGRYTRVNHHSVFCAGRWIFGRSSDTHTYSSTPEITISIGFFFLFLGQQINAAIAHSSDSLKVPASRRQRI